jgi:hypothetical protein
MNKITKITFLLMSTLFAVILIAGCKKSIVTDTETEFPQNKPLIINSSEYVDVRASDLTSEFSSFKRKIEIIDKKNNSTFQTFILTVTNEKTDESVYKSLKSSNFTGSLTVESEGRILLKFKSVNGKNLVESKENLNSGTILNYETKKLTVPCTVTTVHDCVSFKIVDMNWIDYGLCLASAPACYAGLWASCSWDVCVKHKEYVNPIH